ncbi:hypothetical protein VIGAN_10111000, partial [Vigna angularis var. angularis]
KVLLSQISPSLSNTLPFFLLVFFLKLPVPSFSSSFCHLPTTKISPTTTPRPHVATVNVCSFFLHHSRFRQRPTRGPTASGVTTRGKSEIFWYLKFFVVDLSKYEIF